MIFSVGTDIIEIDRVEKACLKKGFMQKVYTQNEISAFGAKARSLAGNFAAKEAVVKAFGTGFGLIEPSEIEILRDEKGKPYVILHGNAESFALKNKIIAVRVSISHNRNDAVAFAVAEV